MRTIVAFHKSAFITFFVLLSSFFSLAQGPVSMPPLPEAASFFKSVEVPVSAYTGLPNIGVDFYTIATKELKIPIRISYNARGIQVAEIASRVGLGWALQCGGMISRQVRGFADDRGDGLMWHRDYNDMFTNKIKRDYFSSQLSTYTTADEFPDQFFFDVNGQSGKFIFDHNDGTIVQQKFSDLKIVPTFEANNTTITSWKITDQAGNKFYYGRSKDSSRSAKDYNNTSDGFYFSSIDGMASTGASGNGDVSAWRLLEIETYLNEKIEFFYETEEGIYYQHSYDKIDQSHANGSADQKAFFSRENALQNQLSEIRFPGGKVLFQKDTAARLDFPGYPLKSITVKNGIDTIIKSFSFTYHYDTCYDDPNQLDYLKLIDPLAKYRLFLDKITERNSRGDSLPPTQFSYDTTKLPNRFSTSQDVWGYYNGAPNGKYLTFLTYNRRIDRRVDSTRSGASILKKIIYPTGGSVEFTYEQNRVNAGGFLDVLSTLDIDRVDSISMMEGLGRDTAFLVSGTFQKDIVIGSNIAPNTHGRFSVLLPVGANEFNFSVTIERTDSAYIYSLYPSSTDEYINLPPGPYRMKVTPGAGMTSGFMASISWSVLVPPFEDEVEGDVVSGAGKRIRKIVHKNGDQTALTKSYEYLNVGGGSSGKMLGFPNFRYKKPYALQKAVGTTPSFSSPTMYMWLLDLWGSGPGSPLTNVQGNTLGYQRVTEYLGDSANNIGKTVYEFTVDMDGGDYFKFPYHLPVDYEWLRGKPVSTEMYKNNGGSYELVKQIVNTYTYAGFENASAKLDAIFFQTEGQPDTLVRLNINDRRRRFIPYLIFQDEDFDIHTNPDDFKVYYQTAGTFDLASTAVTTYSGTLSSTEYTWFDYNYDRHYGGPVAQRTTNSKGDSVVITQTFLPDLDSRSGAQQKMQDSNRINNPVTVKTVVKTSGGTTLSELNKQTIVKDWGGDLVLPEKAETKKGAYAYDTDVTMNAYDGIGNILQFTAKDGVPNAFIWDYNHQYPISKTTNASYGSVAFSSFEADATGNWDYSSSGVRADSGSVTGNKAFVLTSGRNVQRTALDKEQTFLLTFWLKTNGSTVSVNKGSATGGSGGTVLMEKHGWKLYQKEIAMQGDSTLTISGTGVIDEVRLFPKAAQMVTFTYDPLVGITTQCDVNNRITYYEYDRFNRLLRIRDMDKNILKSFSYVYQEAQ